jgi:hypothetical protein
MKYKFIIHHSSLKKTVFMRFLLIFLFFSILAACGQSPSTTSNGQSQPAASSSAATFQFSKKAPVTGLKDENSWCNGDFADATLINADPANSNRRFFQLGEGVYRIAIQLGNATSSFFIRKTAGQAIEIFSSDNFPLCTSNRANFSMVEGDASFKYDNGRGINYSVAIQSSAEGLFVILEFSAEITYGLTVHHCVGCG